MEVIQTAIEGVVIIEPRLFNDARGYFFESFSQRDFDRLVRTVHFVQDNESKSVTAYCAVFFSKTAIRTKQAGTRHQRCRIGCAVDIRKGSPTFGQHVAVELTEENPSPVLYPPRFCPLASACSRRKLFSNINATTFMPRKAKEHWHGTTQTSTSTGAFLPTKSSCRKRNKHHPRLKDTEWLFDYSENLYQ